jgi:ketosteroid isomerase-like protein
MSDNATLVQSAYTAFANGDIGAVLDLLADDVEWTSPRTIPHGGDFHGKADVGQFFKAIGANWKSLPLEIEAVADIGNGLVVGVLRADGTRSTGARQSYGATHVFTVRGGKIQRFREYVDIDAALD